MVDKLVLRTEGLVKRYGKRTVANGVTINVKQGEIVGLLGPNGAGKTTSFYMTTGLVVPNEGHVYLGDQDITNYPVYKRARAGIGYLPQEASVFRKMSVEDNILSVLEMTGKPRSYQLEKLESLINEFRLNKVRKNKGDQLSGGERRRTEIARCLAIDPKFIMLDEPFAAIDAKVRKDLRQWLRSMIHQLGITSIFVTHDQDEAVEVADDIIITNKGHVEQIGTPAEIYQHPATPFVAQFIGESVPVEDYTIFKGFSNGEGSHPGIIRPEFLEIGADDGEMYLPLAAEKGIVRETYFRGNNMQIDVEVKGQLLRGWRSLEKKPLREGDEARVLIHRIYSFAHGQTQIVENQAKQQNSVII